MNKAHVKVNIYVELGTKLFERIKMLSGKMFSPVADTVTVVFNDVSALASMFTEGSLTDHVAIPEIGSLFEVTEINTFPRIVRGLLVRKFEYDVSATRETTGEDAGWVNNETIVDALRVPLDITTVISDVVPRALVESADKDNELREELADVTVKGQVELNVGDI